VDLLEVGRVDRAHGLGGEVIVTLTSDYPEARLAPGSVLTAGDRPLTVTASRPHQQRWLVFFDGVTTRNEADALRGSTLLAEPIEDPDALWVHEVVGAEVVTPDGRSWGPVESVQANPAHDLLVLADGTLVPVVFVVDDAGLPERIVIDPPAGLLDADD
jgi:16S rRNA processing protein RimM